MYCSSFTLFRDMYLKSLNPRETWIVLGLVPILTHPFVYNITSSPFPHSCLLCESPVCQPRSDVFSTGDCSVHIGLECSLPPSPSPAPVHANTGPHAPCWLSWQEGQTPLTVLHDFPPQPPEISPITICHLHAREHVRAVCYDSQRSLLLPSLSCISLYYVSHLVFVYLLWTGGLEPQLERLCNGRRLGWMASTHVRVCDCVCLCSHVFF